MQVVEDPEELLFALAPFDQEVLATEKLPENRCAVRTR